ncbi:hypothetical protein LEMLEM_LOCUS9128 [Lemmus lemmus]
MSKIGRRWGRLAWLPAMLAAGIWSGSADGKARSPCFPWIPERALQGPRAPSGGAGGDCPGTDSLSRPSWEKVPRKIPENTLGLNVI